MEQEPSVCRVVHFTVYNGKWTRDGIVQPICRAAIVTEISVNGAINLWVFHPTEPYSEINVHKAQSADFYKTNTWHWPERT